MTVLEDLVEHLPDHVAEAFRDPSVDHVMLNPDGSVWAARGRRVDRLAAEASAGEREAAALAIARALGFEAGVRNPLVHADLPDGAGVAITCPPVSDGHSITVRRGGTRGAAC